MYTLSRKEVLYFLEDVYFDYRDSEDEFDGYIDYSEITRHNDILDNEGGNI